MISLVRKPLTRLPKLQFNNLCLNIVESFVYLPEGAIAQETECFAESLQDYLDSLEYKGTKEKTRQLRKSVQQLEWAWNCLKNETKNALGSPIDEVRAAGERMLAITSLFNIYHRPFSEKIEKLKDASARLGEIRADVDMLGAGSYLEYLVSQIEECSRINHERNMIIQSNKGKVQAARRKLNKYYQALLSSIENYLIIYPDGGMDEFVTMLNIVLDDAYQKRIESAEKKK